MKLELTSLDWALQHARRYGDTDVFPRLFEFDAIEHDWDAIRDELTSVDARKWEVSQQRTLLSAKSRSGFRVVTQLDPLDFLVFAALVYEIGADLEMFRLPTAEEVAFSYRFSPAQDGRLFDQSIGYAQFVETSAGEADEFFGASYVAVTDIADFYHRIYHHRLENALQAATERSRHVQALMNLLRGWNSTETYGVPVGSAPARLLAEVALADVDESLLASGARFVRFNDDYRIFADSYSEAYRHLASLADTLFRNHGLTLQPQKTHVLDAETFRQRYVPGPEQVEFSRLQGEFRALVRELELDDQYESIEYDDLDPQQRARVDQLNLAELFRESIRPWGEPDTQAVRFVLRRLGQLRDATIVDEVLSNLESLHHVFPDVVRYVAALTDLDRGTRADIGSRVLGLASDSLVSELDYHRMWALELFAGSTMWHGAAPFEPLLAAERHESCKRQLILAMGRAGRRHWFQSQWRSLFEFAPWTRRAVLAAGSCLPGDARRHWYRSHRSRLGPLDLAITRWAAAHPFA